MVKFLVGVINSSGQKIGVAKPSESTRFILDRSSFLRKIARCLMFCQARLALTQKIVDVAAHMMDSRELQGKSGFVCNCFGQRQFGKSLVVAIGNTQTIGKKDTNSELHLCALRARRKMRKGGQRLRAMRH